MTDDDLAADDVTDVATDDNNRHNPSAANQPPSPIINTYSRNPSAANQPNNTADTPSAANLSNGTTDNSSNNTADNSSDNLATDEITDEVASDLAADEVSEVASDLAADEIADNTTDNPSAANQPNNTADTPSAASQPNNTTDNPSAASQPKEKQPLIGVIDTGFSGNNPDIDYSRITWGSDRVNGDDDPTLAPGEGNEHGTHVLGIIAAKQDNDIGIDGINNQAPDLGKSGSWFWEMG
jgi:hypothetical protein